MRAMKWVLTGLAVTTITSAPAFADTSEFLTKAIKGDNSEMKLGSLAARQGQSARVKSFGVMLQREHAKGKDQAVPIAAKHQIVVPAEMSDEAQTEYAKLQGMHGVAFDREFGRYMTEDHQKDIRDFAEEAASKDPAEVRNLARQTLPVLRKHLRMARSIG
ncbi:DUF4142 domain-containing protein [Sphingomonas sp. TREG-RG-20F-R18-01]|uniref:DUF4142 domain-containing protein n=1 Tax=Sphingomonas sp. TREG-RG-20F-R18-01 TaxID=2914982 RepID=UPI001F57B6AB|nr:DUF4142 domain-containing protein [Sphingomonas sp. TREG-RG-20F-R18-01]